MAVEEAAPRGLHGTAIEEACAIDARARKGLLEKWPEVRAHPSIHRQRETPFAPALDPWRQKVGSRLAEHALRGAGCETKAGRLGPEPLHQGPVQERDPKLYRMSHAHDVTVPEKHVGHVGPKLPRAHRLQLGGAGQVEAKLRQLGVEWWIVAERGEGVRPEQGPLPAFREDPSVKRAYLLEGGCVLENVGEFPPTGVSPRLHPRQEGSTKGAGQRAPPGQDRGQSRRVPECGVAAEELVASQAGENRDDAPLPGGKARIVCVDPIAGRLVAGGEKLFNVPRQLSAPQDARLVLGAEMPGRGLRLGGLRVVRLIKSD
jgi:hypothetical protein